jgi:hypothetical protein
MAGIPFATRRKPAAAPEMGTRFRAQRVAGKRAWNGHALATSTTSARRSPAESPRVTRAAGHSGRREQ